MHNLIAGLVIAHQVPLTVFNLVFARSLHLAHAIRKGHSAQY